MKIAVLLMVNAALGTSMMDLKKKVSENSICKLEIE